MIRAVAPGRVNLIGDHTDYTGGLALPMAIDLSTVVEGTRGGRRISLTSGEVGGTAHIDLDHLLASHGDAADAANEPEWRRYVAAVASLVEPSEGFTGRISTTLPVGGGLSSSAALEIALALALGAAHGEDPRPLAELCRTAEHRATGVPTGIMDQLCILSGREGHAVLLDCHSLTVDHVPVPDEVDIVVDFIAPRTLEGSAYAERVAECATAETRIGPLRTASLDDLHVIQDPVVRARARHVIGENERVRLFAAAMRSGDWVGAGQAMTQSHASLAVDYGVSTDAMDAAVAAAVARPGVFGARMTGGGFGGCIVVLCARGADVPGRRVRPSGAARVTVD